MQIRLTGATEGEKREKRTESLFKETVVENSPNLASLVVQTVKSLPAMQETWIQSLGGEDPLKQTMAIHSSTLA